MALTLARSVWNSPLWIVDMITNTTPLRWAMESISKCLKALMTVVSLISQLLLSCLPTQGSGRLANLMKATQILKSIVSKFSNSGRCKNQTSVNPKSWKLSLWVELCATSQDIQALQPWIPQRPGLQFSLLWSQERRSFRSVPSGYRTTMTKSLNRLLALSQLRGLTNRKIERLPWITISLLLWSTKPSFGYRLRTASMTCTVRLGLDPFAESAWWATSSTPTCSRRSSAIEER